MSEPDPDLLGAMEGMTMDEVFDFIRAYNEAQAPEQTEVEVLLDALEGVLEQACYGEVGSGEYDSMALTAYAHGLRVLAKYGRVKIVHEVGRRVIAERPASE